MEALREIVEDAPERLTLELPPHLRHRRLEVIVLPLEGGGEGQPAGEQPEYRIFPTERVVILSKDELNAR